MIYLLPYYFDGYQPAPLWQFFPRKCIALLDTPAEGLGVALACWAIYILLLRRVLR